MFLVLLRHQAVGNIVIYVDQWRAHEAVKVAEEALVTQVLRLKLLIGIFVSSLVV